MLFTLITLAYFATADLAYRKGDVFTYKYASIVSTIAQDADESNGQTFDVICDAKFVVLETTPTDYIMQMTISNVESVVTQGSESGSGQFDADTERYYSLPIIFTQDNSGDITAVHTHENDFEDAVTMKTAILYQLRTSKPRDSSSDVSVEEVIDNQGLHLEYFQYETDGDAEVIRSSYSEEDFIAFVDPKVLRRNIELDGAHTRTIRGGFVEFSMSETTLLLNKDEALASNTGEATNLYTYGSARLFNLRHSNSMDLTDSFENTEDFVNKKGQYRKLKRLTRDYYLERESEPEFEELDTAVSAVCPAQLTACKGFDNSWTIGNNNVGLRLKLSALAGMTKGCKEVTRNYMVGAYASIDVLVLGISITAAEAYAEYGLLNGAPTRNAVELKLFGYSLYKYALPWIECIDKTIPITSTTKEMKFTYSIFVYIVMIQFTGGVRFTFRADLSYSICVQRLTASVAFVPAASVTLFGGAAASIAIARAGIEIQGTISDRLEPRAYIDGNLCQVGFSMYNNFDPITAKLIGYVEFISIKLQGWKLQIGWGPRHSITIWSHSWAGSRTKIIDIAYGAK